MKNWSWNVSIKTNRKGKGNFWWWIKCNLQKPKFWTTCCWLKSFLWSFSTVLSTCGGKFPFGLTKQQLSGCLNSCWTEILPKYFLPSRCWKENVWKTQGKLGQVLNHRKFPELLRGFSWFFPSFSFEAWKHFFRAVFTAKTFPLFFFFINFLFIFINFLRLYARFWFCYYLQ